ncbi:MAG: PepSY domain-containing protein [Leptolyngbya sp. SIO1E4]|nr:PepSY domain-containing protein [Leptolyngbya sp. SIO1E4]
MGDLKVNFRRLHATLAPFVLLPLFMTVTTGVIYRLGKSWLGLSRDQVHFLMVLHEGEYLGETIAPIYVLLNGLGLLWMLATGGMVACQNIMRSRGWRALTSKKSDPSKESEAK